METTIRKASKTISLFLKTDKYTQYDQFTSEADEEAILNSMKITVKLFPTSIFILCPTSHPNTNLLVSDNSEHILGYTSSELKSMSLEDYMRLIYPDDLPGFEQCFDIINKSEPYDPETHRFITHYRFKHKAGHYIHVQDEKVALKTSNNRYVYFTLMKDVAATEKFHQVKLVIYKQTKNSFLKVYTYYPRKDESLITPRQNEILGLIVKGFSNQEIASLLNVSLNTVKNHKQELFKKTKVKSSVQLTSLIQEQNVAY